MEERAIGDQNTVVVIKGSKLGKLITKNSSKINAIAKFGKVLTDQRIKKSSRPSSKNSGVGKT